MYVCVYIYTYILREISYDAACIIYLPLSRSLSLSLYPSVSIYIYIYLFMSI